MFVAAAGIFRSRGAPLPRGGGAVELWERTVELAFTLRIIDGGRQGHIGVTEAWREGKY